MEPQPPPATYVSAPSLKKDALAALFVVLVSVVALVVFTRQWLFPADMPRGYGGDYLVYLTWVQTMIEEGSYLHNSRVGLPLGTDWRGFPTSDGWLSWQVIRALLLIKQDPIWTMNWFFWLTFPMVGVSAFAAARALGISRLVAVAVALLYDFIPYHVFRNGHVFMTAYYLVPWSLYACLQWRAPNPAIGGRNRSTAVYLALAVVTGLGYVYYAYFACILMMTAGVSRSVNDRLWKPLVWAVVWCVVTMGVFTSTMTPEILHKMTTPKNPDATQRHPVEAELYAFKVIQLVLPTPRHQLRLLSKIREQYHDASPLVNENELCSLGMLGSAGFLYLLFRFVFRRPGEAEKNNDLLSLFTIVIVLVATIGGFASIINWLQHFAGMSPWIRCYNRISIVLAFVVLLGLGQLADRRRAGLRTPRGKAVFTMLTLTLTAWGLFDQTPRGTHTSYAKYVTAYESDREYFPQIEAQGAPGDYVFQLGYRFYPECPIEPLTDYELYRPYLNARSLTFSYGALRGEANDVWCRDLSSRPAGELVDHLARMEALGVLVYRPSLFDKGKQIEDEIGAILGEPPLVSPDEKFAFFNLRSRSEHLRAGVPAAEWAAARARLRQPLVPVWRKGFTPDYATDDPTKSSREFGREGEIRAGNGLHETRRLELRFDVKVIHESDATDTRWLRINQNNQDEIVPVPPEGATVVRTFDIPPGETVIRLTTAFERSQLEPGGTPKRCWMILSKISWAEK